MKTKSSLASPALALPRLASDLENLAGNLGRFAAEFGLTVDDAFPGRVATVAFANGVVLGVRDPDAAARLEDLLAPADLPLTADAAGAMSDLRDRLAAATEWTSSVNAFLTGHWDASADAEAGHPYPLTVYLRILLGIRDGLHFVRLQPEAAQSLHDGMEELWVENRFLSRLLWTWRRHDWTPVAAPFVEFAVSCYTPKTREFDVLVPALAAVLPVAKRLSDPWQLDFWIETGWSSGRAFAADQADACRALLEETPVASLRSCHDLYRRCVLGTTPPDGTVQLRRATLHYFGLFKEFDFARQYCLGHEPRRLARVAFDFTFWMAIFAAFPVPVDVGGAPGRQQKPGTTAGG